MKVDNPRFVSTGHGEIEDCIQCPFDHGNDNGPCKVWWYRNGYEDSRLVCPTAETYAEACRLAEQANKE